MPRDIQIDPLAPSKGPGDLTVCPALSNSPLVCVLYLLALQCAKAAGHHWPVCCCAGTNVSWRWPFAHWDLTACLTFSFQIKNCRLALSHHLNPSHRHKSIKMPGLWLWLQPRLYLQDPTLLALDHLPLLKLWQYALYRWIHCRKDLTGWSEITILTSLAFTAWHIVFYV